MSDPVIIDKRGREHKIHSVDWGWTNAAGWDDIYDGQQGRATTMSGKIVIGKFAKTGRSLSERPPGYARPKDLRY